MQWLRRGRGAPDSPREDTEAPGSVGSPRARAHRPAAGSGAASLISSERVEASDGPGRAGRSQPCPHRGKLTLGKCGEKPHVPSRMKWGKPAGGRVGSEPEASRHFPRAHRLLTEAGQSRGEQLGERTGREEGAGHGLTPWLGRR